MKKRFDNRVEVSCYIEHWEYLEFRKRLPPDTSGSEMLRQWIRKFIGVDGEARIEQVPDAPLAFGAREHHPRCGCEQCEKNRNRPKK